MSARVFSGIEPIRFQGPEAPPSLAYRFYDKDRVVRGKRKKRWLADVLKQAGEKADYIEAFD